MFLQKKIKKNLDETNEKLSSLTQEINQIHQEYEEILNLLGLDFEQVSEELQNDANFSPLDWEQIQEEKKRLNDQLDFELAQIPDVAQIKKTRKLNSTVQQNWLFVR